MVGSVLLLVEVLVEVDVGLGVTVEEVGVDVDAVVRQRMPVRGAPTRRRVRERAAVLMVAVWGSLWRRGACRGRRVLST